MHFIGKNLKKDGWKVVYWKYSSRDCLIETHGEKLIKEINSIATKNPEKPINFVAHSITGLCFKCIDLYRFLGTVDG